MKKSSLILGAAALMLATACSNDEVVEMPQTGKAIGFSSFVNKATRATDATEGNLTNLEVYGVSNGPTGTSVIFNATEIKKGQNATVGDNSVWGYEGETQYWIPNFSYSFAAVAPVQGAGVTVNNSSATKTNGGIATIDFVNNGQVDLLYDKVEVPYSTAEGAAWGQLVPFNLQHILSRVVFNFNNKVNTDYKVEVSGIKFTKAYSKGTFTPAVSDEDVDKWEVTGSPAEFKLTEETKSAEYAATATTSPTYLIPVNQPNADDAFEVEFTVDLYIKDAEKKAYNDKANSTYTLTATLPNLNYEMGYSYAFSTDLTWENVLGPNKKEIQFTVDKVEGWKNAEGYNPENKDEEYKGNVDSEKKPATPAE